MSDSLHPMDHSLPDSWTGLPMEFPGKSTGVCCHSLFQGIFWKLPGRLQSMGSQKVGHNLATNTSPGGSFQPRDQIHISCIGRWFIYHWASWEDWEQKSLSPVGLFATQALNSPGWKTGVVSLLFSRGSSQPKDQTQLSCLVDGFFTSWATRKAQ